MVSLRVRSAILLCAASIVPGLSCTDFELLINNGGLSIDVSFVTPERAESTQTQTVALPAGAGLRVVNAMGSTRVAVDPAATSAEVEITRIALADTQEEADALLAQMLTSVTLPTEGNNVLTVTTQKPEAATSDEAQFSATVTDDEIHIVLYYLGRHSCG